MLLNALVSAPEGAEEVLGKSLYLMRAPSAAGVFLYGVGVIAIVIFLFTVLGSLRVPEESSRK
jgi:hypothetical protein